MLLITAEPGVVVAGALAGVAALLVTDVGVLVADGTEVEVATAAGEGDCEAAAVWGEVAEHEDTATATAKAARQGNKGA